MNKFISVIILMLLLIAKTWASDGAGLGQAIYIMAMILYGLAAFSFGLLIHGFIYIRNSKFKSTTHVVLFNLLNFTVLFFILLLLDAIGLSYVDTYIKILVATLSIIQIFMFYKSITIYRHNKAIQSTQNSRD